MTRFLRILSSVVLFSTIFASTKASAHYVWIHCDDDPGLTLCRAMKRIEDLSHYTCTGNACYELWRSQIAAMRQLHRTMETQVPVGIKSPAQVGELAKSSAQAICSQSSKGSCEWMKALFVARRDALAGVVELQKAAGLSVVKTCNLSYSCQ